VCAGHLLEHRYGPSAHEVAAVVKNLGEARVAMRRVGVRSIAGRAGAHSVSSILAHEGDEPAHAPSAAPIPEVNPGVCGGGKGCACVSP